MDSVPRPFHSGASPAGATEINVSPNAELAADDADDPYSQGQLAFPGLVGGVIALATLIVPLGTVLASRPQASPSLFSPTAAPAADLASPRIGEPGGGDSSRQWP